MSTSKAYRIQNRRRVLIENSFTPKLRAEFSRMSAQVGRDYADGGLERVNIGLNTHRANLQVILDRLYFLSVESMTNYLNDSFGKSYKPVLETKGFIGAAWVRLRGVFNLYSLTQSTSIAETTKEETAEIITRLGEEGLPEMEVAKAIVDKLKVRSISRAQTIARTEVGYALNRSQAELIDELDLPPMLKMWMSSPGKRTRKSHRRADNQKQERDQPFVVGGDKMMYPMDRGLGAAKKEIINCRCMMNHVMRPDDA